MHSFANCLSVALLLNLMAFNYLFYRKLPSQQSEALHVLVGGNWKSLAATYFETFLVETLREENKYSFLEKLILRYCKVYV